MGITSFTEQDFVELVEPFVWMPLLAGRVLLVLILLVVEADLKLCLPRGLLLTRPAIASNEPAPP